jgi:hypothetical protein
MQYDHHADIQNHENHGVDSDSSDGFHPARTRQDSGHLPENEGYGGAGQRGSERKSPNSREHWGDTELHRLTRIPKRRERQNPK